MSAKIATETSPAGNKITRKVSLTTVQGFLCGVCKVQTVTYDGSRPENCLECMAPEPKLVWKDTVKNITIVETLKIS